MDNLWTYRVRQLFHSYFRVVGRWSQFTNAPSCFLAGYNLPGPVPMASCRRVLVSWFVCKVVSLIAFLVYIVLGVFILCFILWISWKSRGGTRILRTLHLNISLYTCIYWRGPNYRKEFAVFGLFCNQNQEKHRKNTIRFKVNSSSIRHYSFCLEIQSINWGNPVFFDPSFCCTFRSHRTLLSEAVFLWA